MSSRGVRTTLLELYKEVYPFLRGKDREDAARLWAECKREGPEAAIMGKCEEFDFWLRDALFKAGLLMAKGGDPGLLLEGGR